MPDQLTRLDGDVGFDEPGTSGTQVTSAAETGSGAPDTSGADIGRELFRLVAKARAASRDPEMELRAAARQYLDLVRRWERSARA